MQAIGEYLIGVTAAALLCGAVSKLGTGRLTGVMLKTVCGVFMALAVVAPWAKLELRLPSNLLDIQAEGEALVAGGENSARQAMADIITEQTRTYILDKAAELGMELEAEVVLSGDDIPVPVSVTLRGNASPYGKSVLTEYIREQLGVSEEAQHWIT